MIPSPNRKTGIIHPVCENAVIEGQVLAWSDLWLRWDVSRFPLKLPNDKDDAGESSPSLNRALPVSCGVIYTYRLS